MLPALPGIQDLIQVMRSDLTGRMHPDFTASMDDPCESALNNPGNVFIPNGVVQACHTHAGGETCGSPAEADLPDVVRDSIFHPAKIKPDIVRSGLHQVPSSTVNLAPAIQPPMPTYTVLIPKNHFGFRNDNLHPELKPNPKMESASPSEPPKIWPERTYTVVTPNNIFPRSGPDLTNIPTPRDTRPNYPSEPPANQPALMHSRFQKILPNPFSSLQQVSNVSTNSSPASLKPNPTTAIFYQVLSPDTPTTFAASIPPTLQQTLPNAIHLVPTSSRVTIVSPAALKPNIEYSLLHQLLEPNVNATAREIMTSEMAVLAEPISSSVPEVSETSCVTTKKDSTRPTILQATLLNSGLSIPRNTNHANTNRSQPQQKLPSTVSNTKHPQHSSRSDLQRSTSATNASRMARKCKSRTEQESCMPESRCDGGLSDVNVELAREELWKMLHDQGNEMIVVKQGRQMFPTMDFVASGFRPGEMYSIAVRFVLVDKYRYNFSTAFEEWQAVCEDRHQPGPSRCVEHPASPATGQNWNGKLVSFNELRLTNRATKSKNLVYTPTMRKHRVQLVVTMPRCPGCHGEHTRHVDIPLTEFIAVSSYYSLKTKQLKITHNPSVKTRCLNAQLKRKNCGPNEVTTSQTKKQKCTEGPVCSSAISEENPSLLTSLSRPINSSESTHVIMANNEYLSTTTNIQPSIVPDLHTSITLRSTSNSQLTTMPPSVLQSTSSSTSILQSTSPLPLAINQVEISSRSYTKPAGPFLSPSTTTCSQLSGTDSQILSSRNTPKDPCNTVYTCQTTRPSAHVQTDEDILDYIKIYLSPFLTSEKSEAFDSSVFDELFNVNYISDKRDSFENIVY